MLLSDFFPDRCGKSVVELGTEPVPVLQEAVCLTRHRHGPAKCCDFTGGAEWHPAVAPGIFPAFQVRRGSHCG